MAKEESNPAPIEDHGEHKASVKRQIFVSTAVFLLLVLVTIGIILYGKGYRFGFQKNGQPQLAKTGMLNVNSIPPGAQVYIDNHLTTATNNTINLTPGKYTVKIAKDGYNDWQKDFTIKKEVVSNAVATLFPKAPSLQNISTLGVESVVADPSGTKLAFKIASQSARQRNGIYVFDMTARAFPVLAGQSSSTQIVSDPTDTFMNAKLTWSPDGRQILASIPDSENPSYYLLRADALNETPQDITAVYGATIDSWNTQRSDKEKARLRSLKTDIQKFANKNFRILSWSPDEKKILYQASESADMPVFLKPRRIGNNDLYERRDLQKNSIYVYDISEDVNTRIVENDDELCAETTQDCVTPFSWFPDSVHLLYLNDKKIDIVEYDGSNKTTIYAGPFLDHYVYTWPDGSKLVILTNLSNPGVAPTLYTISLK